MHHYLSDQYETSQKILLITEEHTNNPYYWSNVKALVDVIRATGRELKVAVPGSRSEPLRAQSVDGTAFEVFGAVREGDHVTLGDFRPDLIVSNNDFSKEYADWAEGLRTPMNPPHRFGWFRRRKHEFFESYNRLATEFAETVGVDPFHFRVETALFRDFAVNDEGSRSLLAAQAESVLERVRAEYAKHGVSDQPFLVVKNNAGTYGLGVTMVQNGREIIDWNYKSRKTMKAAKGGRDVEEVIVQEGITTRYREGDETAEPVIYMIGCQLAGGFLRTHTSKGPQQNLNSPGAVYKRMCVSDLKLSLAGYPKENVYGWVAKLALLAISYEAQEHDVEFLGYRSRPCR
jgi:glutamate--cysteine ligase